MFRATMTLLRRGAAAYATTSGVPETPIRPRFKKFEGRIIKGKPMRVREREVVENDEETRTFEDVQQHIEYGLVRPRTPMLDKCKIGFVSLPEAVQLRLNDIVRTVPRDRILQEAADLSTALRTRTRFALTAPVESEPSAPVKQSDVAPVIVYDRVKALAYAAVRLPGVFGCVARVMTELRLRRPEFVPERVLDYGCGPGTALMAIDHVWPSKIAKAIAIEPSSGMEWIAQQIMGDSLRKVVQFNHYAGEDLVDSHQKSSQDMVVASYVLSELATPKARRRMIRSLWARVRPGGVLVVIEPGTPIGFGCVREARHVVLGVGEFAKEAGGGTIEGRATTIAPCPHDGKCPLDVASTWCHFGQRVRRTTLLRASKNATNNFEDEKFSYAILERMTPEAIRAADAAVEAAAAAASKPRRGRPKNVDVFARLLTPPRKRGGHVMTRACFSDGTVNGLIVPHSAGTGLYTSARKSGWGDVLHQLKGMRRDPTIMKSLLPRKPQAAAEETKPPRAPVVPRPPRRSPEPFAEDDDELEAFAREVNKERQQQQYQQKKKR